MTTLIISIIASLCVSGPPGCAKKMLTCYEKSNAQALAREDACVVDWSKKHPTGVFSYFSCAFNTSKLCSVCGSPPDEATILTVCWKKVL